MNRLFYAVFLAAILCISGSLLYEELENKIEYQDILSISGMEYDEAFLSEAARIPGLCSLSPVLEIPVRMQIGEYEMDTVWLALNIEELSMEVESSVETDVGATPVLLLGENALAGLQDGNGHTVSETEQRKLLANFENLAVRYILTEQAADGGGIWEECRIAAVLRSPSDSIYLDYGQGRQLLQNAGSKQSVQKILLTVRGKKNWQRAQGYLQP